MRPTLIALLAAGLLAACSNDPLVSSPLVRGPDMSPTAGAAGATTSSGTGASTSAGGAGAVTSTGGASPVSTGGAGAGGSSAVFTGAGGSEPLGTVGAVLAFAGTFDTPRAVAVESQSVAWVTDATSALVRLDLGARTSSTPPWNAPIERTVFPPSGVMVWNGALYTTQGCSFQKFDPATARVDFLQGGGPGGCGPTGLAPGLYGLATDGRTLYWAYPDMIDMAIFSHDIATIETSYDYKIVAGTLDFAGAGAQDGVGAAVKLDAPRGIVVDGKGTLYFADQLNHAIRRIDLASGETRTLAGALGQPGAEDGPLAEARFNAPQGLAFDRYDTLYVADHDNGLVRSISLRSGMVSTLASADSGAPTRVGHPTGVAVTAPGLVVTCDVENTVLLLVLRPWP
jgi:streptogramin lyase